MILDGDLNMNPQMDGEPNNFLVGNQPSVDTYTKEEIDELLRQKQPTLEQYLKSAAVDGNTLTLLNKDGTPVKFTPQGGGADWVMLKNEITSQEVQEVRLDLKSYGCNEYRIEIDTPAPGSSSGSILYVSGWMYDTDLSTVRNTGVNGAFWDFYPGANNERMCIDLLSMPILSGLVSLRVVVAQGSNVVRGKPLTTKDSGWVKNPATDPVNTEKDSDGHTPLRGWFNLRYTRKCLAGTQIIIWGR